MQEPRFISTLSWAERFISVKGGPFDRNSVPQLVDIGETVDRRCGCTFILRFPPQIGKSLFMQLRYLRSVAITPCESLWYNKTGKDADDFSDQKLMPLIQACQPIMAKYPNVIDSRGSKRLFRFSDCSTSLLSSDVLSHRQQRSAQDLYLDEAWQYAKGVLADIFARSEDYEETRRIIIGETAPDEGGETDVLFKRSPQNVWNVICTHCKGLTELLFGDAESDYGIKWDIIKDEEGFWDVTKASKSTRWICPLCKHSHVFSRSKLTAMNDPKRGARYVPKNDSPDPAIEGWTANAFVFRDWNALVSEWLTAANAKRLGDLSLVEEFTRKKLCLPWSPRRYYEKRVEMPIGDYKLGDAWDGEATHPQGFKCRFITVDVQQNCYWLLCRSWGMYGRSRLFAFKKCFTQQEVADFAKECGVSPADVFVDSAYDPKDPGARGSMWGRTMKMCSHYGFVATNGIGTEMFRHEDGTSRIYAPLKTMEAWEGEAMGGRRARVTLLNYSSRGSKFILHNLRQEKDDEGKARWTIACDASEDYRLQSYAERLQKKKNPKGGFSWEWFQIRDDNHAFDCECVQVVIAVIYQLIGQEAAESASPNQDSASVVQNGV